MKNSDFLDYLRSIDGYFFIEAEARQDKMVAFISKYNASYSPQISLETEGICVLGDVDKWGVELRIYLNDIKNMPQYWLNRKYSNRKYRANEFSYRIDDNTLVYELFDYGYRIGYNNP